jgi:protein SCO1/2
MSNIAVQKILLMVVAVGALSIGIYFAQQAQSQPPIAARVFEPVRLIKAFELTNQHQQKIDNNYFNDHWTLIFLGYTHCPDVCPTTLAQLVGSEKRLKAAGTDNVQVMFVSIDPKRDSPARLKEYTEYFNKDFTAVTGPHVNLYPFVRDLGLLYSMSEDTSLPEYSVNHSGGIVLVNPQGQLHAMFRPTTPLGGIPGIDMAELEADFTQLTKRF